MKIFFFFILVFSFTFSACEKSVSETKPQNVKPEQNFPVNSADNSKIKIVNSKGKVTKINLELVSVELDHEEIKGIMPPMIMEFYVKEKSELEKLKVGDQVNFVLEDNSGIERIVHIEKTQ
jgi:Cu/Ag efflux protein CusF